MGLLDEERPSLTDLAYRGTKQRIRLGRFKSGEKLVVEDPIASRKISDTPGKEAFYRGSNLMVILGRIAFIPRIPAMLFAR